MNQFPPDPEPSGESSAPRAVLTVAFYPPQYAAGVRGAALARLDARLPHLHARTPLPTLRAVLHDSARLLGAHLTLRGGPLNLEAGPWSDGGTLRGETLAAARHRLMLPGAPRPLPEAALRAVTDNWTHGTLLLLQGGQVTEQLNLADELDRLTLYSTLHGWPGRDIRLHAHRLRPGGQLEQWLAAPAGSRAGR